MGYNDIWAAHLCRKMPEIGQKLPETEEIDQKSAETRPKLSIFTTNDSLYEISVLGRKLDQLPPKVVAGNRQKLAKNCRKWAKSLQKQPNQAL